MGVPRVALGLEARLAPGLAPCRFWFELLVQAARHAPVLVGDRPLRVLSSRVSGEHVEASFEPIAPRSASDRLARATDIPLSTIFEGLKLMTRSRVLDQFRDGALPPGVTPVADGVEAVQVHFKLTAAEGRVLKELVEGLMPTEIATHLGLAVGTVRVHLKRVYAKTKTKGQRELLRLVERWTLR